MKIGDLVWFQNPSYTNPYGGKKDKVLVLIESITHVGAFDKQIEYHFIIVESGKKRWAKKEDLKPLEPTESNDKTKVVETQ